MAAERKTTTGGSPRRLPPGLWLFVAIGAILAVSAPAAVIFAGAAEAIAVVVVGVAAMIAASLWMAGAAREPGPAAGDRDDSFADLDR